MSSFKLLDFLGHLQLDAIIFKVRKNSKIVNKTIYLSVVLNWMGENESARE